MLSVFTSRKGKLCTAEHPDNLDHLMDCVGVSMTWIDQLAHVLASLNSQKVMRIAFNVQTQIYMLALFICFIG